MCSNMHRSGSSEKRREHRWGFTGSGYHYGDVNILESSSRIKSSVVEGEGYSPEEGRNIACQKKKQEFERKRSCIQYLHTCM